VVGQPKEKGNRRSSSKNKKASSSNVSQGYGGDGQKRKKVSKDFARKRVLDVRGTKHGEVIERKS